MIDLGRSRHGTGTVFQKIFSLWDQVPEFFSPRDSPPKSSPGIPRPTNLSPGPIPRSRIFPFWGPDFNMSPGPGSRFPWPRLRDPGDPVPYADPWLGLRKHFLTQEIHNSESCEYFPLLTTMLLFPHMCRLSISHFYYFQHEEYQSFFIKSNESFSRIYIKLKYFSFFPSFWKYACF